MNKIPVFVSCPTNLNDKQNERRKVIIELLDELQMEPRALGRSDYPKDYPLKEVYVIAKQCAGGVILGFEQLYVKTGIQKRGITDKEKSVNGLCIPTEWNNLEAGILYGLKIPLLIFKEEGIQGGVFDYGITDVFINSMPLANLDKKKRDELKQVFLKWHSIVSQKYYEY